MNKINIENYSNCELCLIVSNTEKYYNLMREVTKCEINFTNLIIELNKKYKYNPFQLKELINWLYEIATEERKIIKIKEKLNNE